MNKFVQAMPPAGPAAAPSLSRVFQISCQIGAVRRLFCMWSIDPSSPSPVTRLCEPPFIPADDETVRMCRRCSGSRWEDPGDKAVGCVQRRGSR